jgi:ribonuclease VapC
MIVDSSALLAIVFREDGWDALVERLESSSAAAGTPTLAETGIVLQARLGKNADGLLERLLDELSIQEVPFGEIHWREAVEAYRRFGKRRHPAALNFGDCMTYAVARLSAEPLLYTGGDFSRTDLDAA